MDTSQYFYRNVILSKQGNTICLIDINAPKEKGPPLEPWLGVVLQFANGQRTIAELFQIMSKQYQGGPPASLQKTIHSVIERLAKMKLLVLTKEPITLPYYLSLPYEQLDVAKAKKLLKQDNVNLN